MLENLRGKNYWLHKRYGTLVSCSYRNCLSAIGKTSTSVDTQLSVFSQLTNIMDYEKGLNLSWDACSKTVYDFHELTAKVSLEMIKNNRKTSDFPFKDIFFLLERAESYLPQNSAVLFITRMYLNSVRMRVYFGNGQPEVALLIADQLVREVSMVDSIHYSMILVVVMDCIIAVHLAQKCTESIKQDFYLLDKMSEFYPLAQSIKRKHANALVNLIDENIEIRVVEEPEISIRPLVPQDEDGPNTPTLISDDLNLETLMAIFSSNGNETNLPWDEII